MPPLSPAPPMWAKGINGVQISHRALLQMYLYRNVHSFFWPDIIIFPGSRIFEVFESQSKESKESRHMTLVTAEHSKNDPSYSII